jgi:hypothetical protein
MRRLTLACCLLACTALAAPVPKAKDEYFKAAAWGRPVGPDKGRKFSFGKDSLTIEVADGEHDLRPADGLANAPRLLRGQGRLRGDRPRPGRVPRQASARGGRASDGGPGRA